MGLALAALAAGALAAAPQTEAPLVVRLGVDLVQVDVVVTDKKGRAVTDLTAADFEVFQDGRRQTVSQVVYVGGTEAAAGRAPSSDEAADPASSWEPMDTLVFVVDDLALSTRSVAATTGALLRFADHMDPEGRLFLVRTGGSRFVDLRPLQGPAELRAAARSLRSRALPGTDPLEAGIDSGGLTPFRRQAQSLGRYLGAVVARQSLLSLQSIVDALRGWKGRKTVVLFSEGYPIWDPRAHAEVPTPLDVVYGRGAELLDAVDRLTDLANRASVVVNAIDPRGLVAGGISASDSVINPQGNVIPELLQSRRAALFTGQAGLARVAEGTGGRAIVNNNDVVGGVAEIVSGSRAYYLVGYEPDRSTFGGTRPSFHELRVRVKRRGLEVRSRRGFFGLSDEDVTALAPPQAF